MSRAGRSVPILPSTVGTLLGALLNGAWWLTGKTSTSQDSPKLLLSSGPLQIINDEKIFTTHLAAQIKQWGLRDAGFNYNIVAVFGSQSAGKSTLLNSLFGTTFNVMDNTKRQQTTKGIWMCRGEDTSVMVMDLEGADGRERGEDQDFERKFALFSFASSEVILINLWEQQIGLYQGANMGLLKTVFEVNLSLFGRNSAQDGSHGRTLLLFVIRDHIGTTPLANLQTTLTADLTEIWDSLSKPQDLQDRQLSDYFDLAFTTLPHKILAPDTFQTEVQELRKRFVDKARNDFVFKTAYHKRVPADGVALYMKHIWEQVQTNKDIDLPTRQELLAQFRCDEISSSALADFLEQTKLQRKRIEAGHVVDGLGNLMRDWKYQALYRYDSDASRYHEGVYKRKRADLLVLLNIPLSPLFLGQLRNLRKSCISTFKKEILADLRSERSNFSNAVSEAWTKCETRFTNGAKEALLDDTDWMWHDDLKSLRDESGSVADECWNGQTGNWLFAISHWFGFVPAMLRTFLGR